MKLGCVVSVSKFHIVDHEFNTYNEHICGTPADMDRRVKEKIRADTRFRATKDRSIRNILNGYI